MESLDYIIVGQGIAGSVLAYELFLQGFRIRVIDDGHCSSASIVAAGILNPITGQRLVKSWEVDKFLPVAKSYYEELEAILGVKFFKAREILRLFKSNYEIEQYEKRKREKGYEEYLGARFEPASFGNVLHDEGGSFSICGGANLDTKVFLSAMKGFFKKKELIAEQAFEYEAVEFSERSVAYKGVRSRKIIFCEGYKVIENPWFKDLKWEHAKGEILTLKIKDHLPDKIINCGKWLMPIADGLCKVGASYNWKDLDNQPTESGCANLIEEVFKNILVSDECELVGQEAGVRPCTRDTKPYIGLHPEKSCLGIFNGFGSKGTLLAPYYARQFVDFLEMGMDLDKEILVNR